MTFVTAFRTPLPLLLAECAHDLRPGLFPSVVADDVPQRQHWVDMRPCPMHATALQTGLDHELVSALYGPVSDRPTGRPKSRIRHVCNALLQVSQFLAQVWLIGAKAGQVSW